MDKGLSVISAKTAQNRPSRVVRGFSIRRAVLSLFFQVQEIATDLQNCRRQKTDKLEFGGQGPQLIRYQPGQSTLILWAPRPELRYKFEFENL